jgi:hypothetical protein
MQQLRSPQDAAIRMLALAAVSGVAQGISRVEVANWLVGEGLWSNVSPAEKSFLDSAFPSKSELIKFSWRMECVYVFGWALMVEEVLNPPMKQASIVAILDLTPAPGESTAAFIQNAKLRDGASILQAAQDYMRMHGQARRARSEVEMAFDIEVIQERHLALNWLTGTDIVGWDLVSTDT